MLAQTPLTSMYKTPDLIWGPELVEYGSLTALQSWLRMPAA